MSAGEVQAEASVTVTVVDHPLVAERLRTLRDVGTTNATFRRALAELGTMLVYEATRSLATVDSPVTTPLTVAPARQLLTQPVVVPVLRAGLGLLESAMNLLPDADVGFIGMARDEATVHMRTTDDARACVIARELPQVQSAEVVQEDAQIVLRLSAPLDLSQLSTLLVGRGIGIRHLVREEPTLEQVFMTLTKGLVQ